MFNKPEPAAAAAPATIRAAILSTDASFREMARAALAGVRGVAIGAEIGTPFDRIDDAQLAALRDPVPELICLDLGDDPALGIRFAQFLSDQNPAQRIIAVGPTLVPELLLGAMRAGVTEYLQRPASPDELTTAVERVVHKLGGAAQRSRKPGQIYTVFGAKGGAGSTTMSANLAIVLHQITAKKTLLIDLDLELGESAVLLGTQPRFNFVDLVQNFHRLDAGLLASYIERHSSGIDLLSAPYHPDGTEQVTGDQIRRILHFLRQHYDYLLIDTPRSFSPATLAALEQADIVFIVTNVDLPSLRNIQRALPLLRRVLSQGEDKLRLVINRFDPHDTITLADVERTLGLKHYWTLSNDYEAVAASINTGKPVVLNRRSIFARDLRALGADLSGLRAHRNGKGGRLAALLLAPIFRILRPPAKAGAPKEHTP